MQEESVVCTKCHIALPVNSVMINGLCNGCFKDREALSVNSRRLLKVKDLLIKGLKSFFTLKPKRYPDTKTSVAVFLAVLIPLTQALDYLTTNIGLQLGASEMNPIMEAAILGSGITMLALIKALSSVFLVWFSWRRPVAALVMITLFAVVILNNLIVITVLVNQ